MKTDHPCDAPFVVFAHGFFLLPEPQEKVKIRIFERDEAIIRAGSSVVKTGSPSGSNCL